MYIISTAWSTKVRSACCQPVTEGHIPDISIICQLYSFVIGELQVLNMFVLQVVEWACIVAPVNTQYILNTHPHPPLHTPPPSHTHTHTHTYTPSSPHPHTPHTFITAFFKHTLHETEWLDAAKFWRENGGHFLFYANYEVKRCNIPLNSVKLGLSTPDVNLKCYVLGYKKLFGQ